MKVEKAPFTYYREGYVDGYYGHDLRCPDSDNYMTGYQVGKEADQTGEPSRYEDDLELRILEAPVKPAQCL